MPFVPDPTPGFVPDDKPTPNFQPDKPSILQRAKRAAVSFLSGGPEKAMLDATNRIDAGIKKVRSETIPNLVPKTLVDKKTPVPTAGTAVRAAGSYLTSGAIKVKPEFKTTKEVVKDAAELVVPTTKEAAAGALGIGLVKGAIKPANRLLEKLSPKFAATQGVKREVEALGRIATNKGPTEMGPLRGLKPGEPIKTSKNYLIAVKTKDGKVMYDRAARSHAEVAERFLDDPKFFEDVAETGFVTPKGKYVSGSVSGEVAKKQMAHFKTTGKHADKNDIDQMIKDVVGDLEPKDPADGFKPIISRRSPGQFIKSIASRVLPEERGLRLQGKSGGALADDIIHTERDAQVMAGKGKEKTLPLVLKLSKEDKANLADYIEPRFGAEKPVLSEQGKEAAEAVRSQLKAWGRFLERQDFEVMTKSGPRKFFAKKEFFPRAPDFEALKKPDIQKAEARHLIETGQANDVEEAQGILETILKARSNLVMPGDFARNATLKKLSTIERPRVYNLLHVDQDPVKNLNRYFDSVAKRVNVIRYFGQGGDKLNARLAAVAQEGGDAEFAGKIADRVLGRQKNVRSSDVLVREIKAAQAITKLGLAPIANVQQGVVNGYIRSGSAKATASGVRRAFTKEGASFARKAGVIENAQVDEYLEQIAGIDEKDLSGPISNAANKFLKAVGFKASEAANRIQAANIGREYVEKLAADYVKNPKNKLAMKELGYYGVNLENLVKRGKVTENELLKAANTFVGETQFASRPLSQPNVFQSSGLGKIVGQFSAFPIGQARMVAKSMGLRGATTPARVAATATGIGLPLEIARRKLSGRDAFEEKPTLPGLVAQSVARSGALGKAGSLIESSKYGTSGPLKALGGPTVSDLGQLIYGLGQLKEGKKKPLGRFITKQIPLAGPALAAKLFPADKKKKK